MNGDDRTSDSKGTDSKGTDPRVLRELVREAAQDPLPALDFDRIEARLFAELDDERSQAEGASSGTRASWEASRPSTYPSPSAYPSDPVVASARAVTPSESAPAMPALGRRRSMLAREPEALHPDEGLDQEESQRGSTAARSRRFSRAPFIAAFAAAAALLGVWITREHVPSDPTPVAVAEPIDAEKVPMAPGMDGAHDLAALEQGDIVEAAVGPLDFGSADTMRWTLSAGSRLVVLEGIGSGKHAVELQSGSLRGSLSKDASVPLVVAAGDTEVVSIGPGSIFSVTRSSKRIVMQLEQGSASVGERGHPDGGRVFVAPLFASFSLDGGKTFELLSPESLTRVATAPEGPVASIPATSSPFVIKSEAPRQEGPRVEAREASAPSSAPSGASAKPSDANSARPATTAVASAQPAPPPSAEPGPAKMSDSALGSTVVGCMARIRNDRQAKAAEGVKILVNSVLSIQVNDDGSVRGATFNPPLERELQGCAVFVLRSKLEPGARVVSVPISLP